MTHLSYIMENWNLTGEDGIASSN